MCYYHRMSDQIIGTLDLSAPADAPVAEGENDPHRVVFGADQLAAARKIIDKANRRLARAGVTDESFALDVVGTEVRSITAEGGNPVHVEVVIAHLSHPRIAVGGWEFLAKAEYDPAADAILVHASPDADAAQITIPESMRCDHCSTTRARRKCYLIGNNEGETMLVGSSCVAPFLGLSVSALWWLDDDSDPGTELAGLGGGGARVVQRDQALALAWVISDEGRDYAPSAAHRPTRGAVAEVLWPPRIWTLQERQEAQQVAEAAAQVPAETVAAIVAAADTLDAESSYGHNLQAIVDSEWVSAKNLGYLVSLVKVHRGNLDKQARVEHAKRAPEQAPQATRGLYAPEGSKITGVAAVVWDRRTAQSDYGSTAIVTFRTESGHQLKWMSSSDTAFDLDVGDKVLIERATVKKLDVYRDIESTQILRPKITVTETAEPEREP